MKTFKRVFAVAIMFAALGLSISCTEQDLESDDQQIEKKEIKESDV